MYHITERGECGATGFDEEFDVVVVGSGAAGAAAALDAHQAGATVLVVEKCDEATAGGNTRVSGSGWWVNRTRSGLASSCTR